MNVEVPFLVFSTAVIVSVECIYWLSVYSIVMLERVVSRHSDCLLSVCIEM